jgi:hypothetical protein
VGLRAGLVPAVGTTSAAAAQIEATGIPKAIAIAEPAVANAKAIALEGAIHAGDLLDVSEAARVAEPERTR